MGTGIAWTMRHQGKAEFLSSNGTQTGQKTSAVEPQFFFIFCPFFVLCRRGFPFLASSLFTILQLAFVLMAWRPFTIAGMIY